MNKRKFRNIVLTGIMLLVLSSASLSAFGFTRTGGHHGSYAVPDGLQFKDLELADGLYTGTAEGFRPGLVVEVRVDDSEVVEITVVDHNEVGRQYYQRPINLIPGDIIAQQRTDVDVVSGASATSYAIMSAVENALSGASR